MPEKAERRDRRKLGREMDLYHFRNESPGAVFRHPKGQRLFQGIRERQSAAGDVEVDTPESMDRSLDLRSPMIRAAGSSRERARGDACHSNARPGASSTPPFVRPRTRSSSSSPVVHSMIQPPTRTRASVCDTTASNGDSPCAVTAPNLSDT